MKRNWLNLYSNTIQEELGLKQVFFYWKARVGLYNLLKAIDIKKDDEVLVIAYTCVVVPNTIIYLGAKPVYIDIHPRTHNLDINQIEQAITAQTKAIICQNTYGLSSDLNELNKIAQKHGLFTIEDCAHGFGGTYNGISNGLSCDAAIYSTQWTKPFSTGIGGFTVARDPKIAAKIFNLNQYLSSPSFSDLLSLKIMYFIKRYLVNDFTYWPLVRLYRWLSRRNIVLGSSSSEEVTSIEIPRNYFKKFSQVQAKEGLRALRNFPKVLTRRKESALVYTEFLQRLGKNHIDKKWFDNHSFLRYPLLVHSREQVMALAEKHHIELGEWFSSPLHPIESNLSNWHLDFDQFPVASFVCDHIVNLPTTPSDITKVLDFLSKYTKFIIDQDELEKKLATFLTTK